MVKLIAESLFIQRGFSLFIIGKMMFLKGCDVQGG